MSGPGSEQSPKQAAFLIALAQVGTIRGAAKLAKVDRHSHDYWRQTDPLYPERLAAAMDDHRDRIDEEVCRRAFVGLKKPIVYQGVQTGETSEIVSDRMLELYAKRHIPEYRDGAALLQSQQVIVIESPDWYGNTAHDLPAEGSAASGPSAAVAGAIQDGRLRPAVGQNGNGAHGDGEGPRPDAGDVEGSD